jgi:hypothetical protein
MITILTQVSSGTESKRQRSLLSRDEVIRNMRRIQKLVKVSVMELRFCAT